MKAVRVFGARYGGGYDPGATTFTVAVGDHSEEAKYELFAPGRFAWVEIPLETPVEVKKIDVFQPGTPPAHTGAGGSDRRMNGVVTLRPSI